MMAMEVSRCDGHRGQAPYYRMLRSSSLNMMAIIVKLLDGH